MYPDFQYLFQALLGTDMPEWLSLFKTFGFLVALSFIAAAYTLVSELKRKEQAGLLSYTEKVIWKGKKATVQDYALQALIGFILAYKIGGIIQNATVIAANPLAFILSLDGALGIGLLGAIITLAMKYYEEKKNNLEKPVQVKIRIYPHQRINDIVMVAAIGGIVGAKVFNAFETWDQFIKNPIEQLIASSGLTFYGGLIIATLALYRYAKKHQINFAQLCDAAAPGLTIPTIAISAFNISCLIIIFVISANIEIAISPKACFIVFVPFATSFSREDAETSVTPFTSSMT